MALNGSVSTGSYDGRYYKLSWTAEQSVANNTSTISWTLEALGGASPWYAERTLNVTIDGSSVFSKTDRVERYKGTIKSGTKTITHKTDGTRSFTIEIKAAVYGTSVNCTGSKTFALNTIDGISTFTLAGDKTMGSAQTITISRQNSSYKHTLYYKWQGKETTIATSVGTSYTWTPPANLAADIPNATSDTCELWCTTYTSSGAKIGSFALGFKLKVPSTVVPTISEFTLSEAVEGIAAQFGAYVNGKSKIAYTVRAAGAQGSTIKSYSVNIAGQNLTGASGESGLISATAGANTATVTVTDSRGRSATANTSFTVYEYAPPQVNFTAIRATSDGTEDSEGTFLKWGIVCEVSPCGNKNTATFGLGWKLPTSSSYTAIETDITPNTYSVNKAMTLQSPNFSTDNSYDIRFVVTDFFGEVARTVPLSTGAPIFDIEADGSGMGFAMVSGKNEYGFKKPIGMYGGFKAIPISATEDKPFDLNNLLQAGLYHCTDTLYLTNNPYSTTVNATASLWVLECGNDGQLAQIYVVCSKGNFIEYRRFYYYSAWGDWAGGELYGNKLLWDGRTTDAGGYYMQASHTINLSTPISKQRNGIVLAFCLYSNNKAQDTDIFYHFIPKTAVEYSNGKGHAFMFTSGNFSNMARKYLYIHDTKIVGDDTNISSGAVNGINYDNKKFVIRYVYGV